jgi:ribosome-binding factor A
VKKLIAAALAVLLALPAHADDKIGIFETIYHSDASFAETVAAIEAAAGGSSLELHGSLDVRVPDDAQQAKVFVLTSPNFIEAARAEVPRTISAQILRIAVFTWGDEQKAVVNMANPVAHAMVYYADSPNYDEMVAAAHAAADELRQLVSTVPGEAVSVQIEPLRKEKHYNKYKGDGPARMMAKFRTWEKSQLLIEEDSAENLDAVVERVVARLEAGEIADETFPYGWEIVAKIPVRDDAVYIGLTNPYIENRMVHINSSFRSKDKTDKAPYPGVDHATALPTDVLIVREAGKTRVFHYGQMWRMQLYFWDSGYRAFTANVNVPGKIANSIEAAIEAPE